MATKFVDRVPTYANRMKITPDSGAAYFATIVRADSPTQNGTPLNAATFNGMQDDLENQIAAAQSTADGAVDDAAAAQNTANAANNAAAAAQNTANGAVKAASVAQSSADNAAAAAAAAQNTADSAVKAAGTAQASANNALAYSSGTATRNTTNTVSGTVTYHKCGRVVTAYIDLNLKISVINASDWVSFTLATGLPKPVAKTPLELLYIEAAQSEYGRFQVDASGQLIFYHHDGDFVRGATADAVYASGVITYISAS